MNVLFNDFGLHVNIGFKEQYHIKNVCVFGNGKIYIIENYFDHVPFEIKGDVKRKLKLDLYSTDNFVIKAEKTEYDYYDREVYYNLYLNADLNDYKFLGLKLIGTRLELNYTLNGIACDHCIGWNEYKSREFESSIAKRYEKICVYDLKHGTFEEDVKAILKDYKQYKKALAIEETYTEKDYKKMQLVSGTSLEENKTMLESNGFDIKGV